MKIVHTITNVSGDRKIDVFQREDETYGFEPQRWLEDEEAWATDGRYSECRIASLEDAISEAIGRVDWVQKERH